jgi:hypothetical protein
MNQYVEPAHPVLQQICADDAIFCTEDLFMLVEEEEHPNGHVGYTYTFANTEAGIMAHKLVSELMEREDPYDLDLWLDAMVDVFGVDTVWAPVVRNERIEFEAVVWA